MHVQLSEQSICFQHVKIPSLFVPLLVDPKRPVGIKQLTTTSIDIQITRKIADQTGVVVYPHQWLVERTSAWINHESRLVGDFEQSI